MGRNHLQNTKKNLKEIVAVFQKKWHPQSKKDMYEQSFSFENWKSLSTKEKEMHTLAECTMCFQKHYDLQCTFPAAPIYTPTLSPIQNKISSENEFILAAISTVDKVCLPAFGRTFIESLTKSHHIEKHKSKTEKRKERRQKTRAICARKMNVPSLNLVENVWLSCIPRTPDFSQDLKFENVSTLHLL